MKKKVVKRSRKIAMSKVGRRKRREILKNGMKLKDFLLTASCAISWNFYELSGDGL